MINLFIAEDHKIVREGIISMFHNNPDFTVQGEADNGQQAIDRLPDLQVDVALVDINMPEVNGIQLTKHIVEHYPETKVLVLTMHDSESYVKIALEAGVTGFILKTASKDELMSAIRTVASGEIYISHKLSFNMIKKPKVFSFYSSLGKKIDVEFSKRELEILHLVAEGYTNEEIADKTFTSKRTVETHRKNMIEKTGTRNSASLIRFAFLNGIIK